MSSRTSVPSAEFIRNIGHWENEALRAPVFITHHGRERLVLTTPDQVRSEHETPGTSGAEKDLSLLRADVLSLTEIMDEGFIAFDPALAIQYANRVAQAFVGRSQEELSGASAVDTMPQPLGAGLTERLRRVLRSRNPERFEAGTSDGHHLSFAIFPYADAAAVVFTNITEQHVTARDLEQAAALRSALHAQPHALAISLDLRGRIDAASPQIADMLGFEPGVLVGHRLVDLIAPDQRHDVTASLETLLRDGAPALLPVAMLKKDGSGIGGMLTLAPILSDFSAMGALAIFFAYPG